MDYATVWLFVIGLGIIAYDGGLAMLMPVLPTLLVKLKMDASYLGTPLLIFGLGQILGTILYTYALATYTQRKLFLIICFMVLFSSGLTYGILTTFYQLLIATGLHGMGSGMIWQIALVLVSELYKDNQQSKINGYLFACFNLATIISPIYGAYIVDLYGFYGFGVSIVILSIICLCSCCFCKQDLKYHFSSHSESLATSQLFNPILISGLLLSFVSAGLRAGLEVYIPIVLKEKFFIKNSQIGLFYLFITVPAFISCLFLGKLTHIFSEYTLVWIGLLFLAISVFLVLFSSLLSVFCIGLSCLALGFTYTSAPVPSFLVKLMRVHPSALHGLRNMFTAFGIGFYPFGLGIIVDALKIKGLAIALLASIGCIIPFLLLVKVKLGNKQIT